MLKIRSNSNACNVIGPPFLFETTKSCATDRPRIDGITRTACLNAGSAAYSLYNWSLQPFSQDYNLIFHTTHVVCIHFVHEWQNLHFKVDTEREDFLKTLRQFLLTFRVFTRNSLNEIFARDVWDRVGTMGCRLMNQHTTYQTIAISSPSMIKEIERNDYCEGK